jgi:hypothetical protein
LPLQLSILPALKKFTLFTNEKDIPSTLPTTPRSATAQTSLFANTKANV